MTRAIILAAGQGTRLRPLTDDKPKALVKLAGRPLIDYQLQTMSACGITDIHIAGGYRADVLQRLGLPTTINPRFASTNMVASLLCAREFITSDEDLLISYGDIVYEPQNLQAVMASPAEIALMIDLDWRALWTLRQEDPLQDAETLVMDAEHNVLELGKKPDGYERIQGQYTGLIKVRGDKCVDLVAFYDGLDQAAEYDGGGFDNMYMTSFLQLLIDAGWDTKAVTVHGGWLEVDSVDDLQTYEQLRVNGELDRFCQLPRP